MPMRRTSRWARRSKRPASTWSSSRCCSVDSSFLSARRSAEDPSPLLNCQAPICPEPTTTTPFLFVAEFVWRPLDRFGSTEKYFLFLRKNPSRRVGMRILIQQRPCISRTGPLPAVEPHVPGPGGNCGGQSRRGRYHSPGVLSFY